MVVRGVQGIGLISETRTTPQEVDFVAALAIKYRLPAVGSLELGFLLICSPSLEVAAKRAAYYVDRVLKGAMPRDLPVEQVTTFRLLINTTTAKAIGLNLPRGLLVRADELVE